MVPSAESVDAFSCINSLTSPGFITDSLWLVERYRKNTAHVMRLEKWKRYIAAGCGWLACATAIAQTNTDITRMSIEDLANAEVFSASRYLQKTIDAPASTTIITADEIRQFGYRSLGEVVANARDFYSSDDRNYVYVGVRGFARPGDYNSRLLLLVDGHRINDPVFDQGDFDRVFPVDIDLIDRIEIVRGPTSSLYGTNAMLAVVNVITRKAEALNGVQVSSEVGAMGAYGGRISFGRSLPHDIGLLVSVSARNDNGEQKVFFPEYKTPSNNFGVAEGLDGERARSAYLAAGGHGVNFRGAFGRRFKLVPTATFGSLFNLRESTVDSTGYLDLSVEKTGKRFDLRGHVAYDSYVYDGIYSLYRAGPPYLDLARAKWWTADALAAPHIGRRQKLQSGFEVRYAARRAQFSSANDVGLGALSGPFTWSVFVQDEIEIVPRLRLVAGLRYDDLASGQTRASPRAALVFKPGRLTALKFLAASAFRAPNAYEQAYSAYQLQLPQLRPEKITALEGIAEHSFSDGTRISLSLYRNSIDGLISQTGTDTRAIGYVNVGDVDTTGLSAEIEKRSRSGWHLRASWSAQRSLDPATRHVISNSPAHLFKAAVVAPLFRGRLDLGITHRYGSGLENMRGVRMRGQNLTDVTLSSTRLFRRTEVSASLYNLFDQRFYVPAAQEHLQESIPQVGRTWRIKLMRTF